MKNTIIKTGDVVSDIKRTDGGWHAGDSLVLKIKVPWGYGKQTVKDIEELVKKVDKPYTIEAFTEDVVKAFKKYNEEGNTRIKNIEFSSDDYYSTCGDPDTKGPKIKIRFVDYLELNGVPRFHD